MNIKPPHITFEHTKDIPNTPEIERHPLFLHFCKWLGDHYVPTHFNKPMLFADFLAAHNEAFAR